MESIQEANQPVQPETLRFFDRICSLIDQEGYMSVELMLRVLRSMDKFEEQMLELVDVLLAFLKVITVTLRLRHLAIAGMFQVPISFFHAWCIDNQIPFSCRVKALMKERRILEQRRRWQVTD